MKRLLITLALTCVLSGSVLAGDVDTAGAPKPAPAPTASNQDGTDQSPVNEAAVNLLLTLLDLAF